MYPARTRNLWLATSASAGAARNVGMKSSDHRCISWSTDLGVDELAILRGPSEDWLPIPDAVRKKSIPLLSDSIVRYQIARTSILFITLQLGIITFQLEVAYDHTG